MDKFRFFALIAVIAFACTAFGRDYTCGLDGEDYDRVNIGWDGLWFKDGNKTGDLYNGLRLEYLHGFVLVRTTYYSGMYFGTGVSVAYNRYCDYEYCDNLVSIEVPLNLSYAAALPGEGYIEPFIGPHLRLNAGGWTRDDWGGYDNWFDYHGYRRCQFGGQVGINAGYGSFNFCVAYRIDTPLYKVDGYKMNTNSVEVGIGFNF